MDLTNSINHSREIGLKPESVKPETSPDAVKPDREVKDEVELKAAVISKPKSEPIPVIDNRVSTIKVLVKEEAKDSPRAWNAISVVMPPSSITQEKPTQDNSKEMMFENVTRAIKSDQQAKIPLKKRELKRSEGYDISNHYSNVNHNNNNLNTNGSISTGGIIVRNPAVLLVKENIRSEYPTEKVSTTGVHQDLNITSSCGNETSSVSYQKTIREQYVGVGVIKGPLELKRPLTENDKTTDKNGLHGNGMILKPGAGDADGGRQSVLVGKSVIKTDNGAVGCSVPEELLSEDVSKMSGKASDLVEHDSLKIESVEENKNEKAIKIKNSNSDRRKTDKTTENESKDKGLKSPRKRGLEKSKSKLHKGEEGDESSSKTSKVLPVKGETHGHYDDGEVSSELQKEGIRLKIKIPLHRRTPELQHKDVESETGNRRSLRRSPRICKPSPKAADVQDRKKDRKLTASSTAQDEDEHVKDGEAKVQPKKVDLEGQTKPLKVTYKLFISK